MQKILMSSCLLGAKVRYDGGDCKQNSAILEEWLKEGRIVNICPEMAGGMPTPRPSSEIVQGRVMTHTGVDVTAQHQAGAELALALCKKHNIKMAILKARSPSCGNVEIYDGTFSGKKIKGQGFTAALLTQNGITVFNEFQLQEAAEFLKKLER